MSALPSRSKLLVAVQDGLPQNALFELEVDVLIFEAEDQINQRPAVNHVIDPAAGIPAVIARRPALTGDRRAAKAA